MSVLSKNCLIGNRVLNKSVKKTDKDKTDLTINATHSIIGITPLSRVLDILNQQLGMQFRGDENTVIGEFEPDEIDYDEILTELEIEFNVMISVEEVMACKTPGMLVQLVQKAEEDGRTPQRASKQ